MAPGLATAEQKGSEARQRALNATLPFLAI